MAEGTARTMRIMLVDDHAPFRRAMAALLDREADLEVVAQAGSLEEARRHAASASFDVALLDLGLPDGSGLDVIGDLRRDGSGTVVIVLSNSLDPTNRQKVTEAGSDEILPKIAAPEEVIGAIRRLRGRS